jgi:hypothetical protein
MVEHTVSIEAMGYGDVEAEQEALSEALEAVLLEAPPILVDPDRGMILVRLTVEGADALDVHDEAVELWRTAWGEAFPEQPQTARLAVTVVPVTVVPVAAEVPGASA